MNRQTAIDSDQTILCTECGTTLIGDPPAIHTLCDICQEIIESAYPDGWTCEGCDTVFYDRMPGDTSDGTICKNCHKEKDINTEGK